MNRYIMILMCVTSSYAAHRPPSPLTIRIDSDSPPSESSSDDILCNAAIQAFDRHKSFNSPDIRRYVLQIIQEDKNSPLVDHQVISSGITRIQMGDFPVNGNHCMDYINDVVVKATSRIIQEQQDVIRKKEQAIEKRYNKRQVLAACSVITSLVSTIVGLVVNYATKC